MAKLQDKVVIITGGISGIGKASAELFNKEGAKLVLVDLDENKGNEAAKEIGGETIFVQADVTSEEDAKKVFDTTIEKFGRVDILFNNAGIGVTKATHEVTYAEYRKTVNVDLDAVFLYSKLAIDYFREQGSGNIINTASMYGWIGAAGNAAYNAAKGGVINLTRSLGIEYAAENIRVNALCPGFIDTPIIPVEMKEALIGITPIGRLGTSEEMAKAALFLASDDSSFMTANTLTVDGGFTAQ
ncbi:NAD(P)-dependent dehydrogenase, short-chain alcohol dehydrogenase family [Jeotgalicoccus aerolatus]|uniref:Diacetyl reductase [(S)-acetoin forming] n=1 Tax=Jeotgalicoccus aerolatus TaxID=709510 RepID=A0A1G8XEY2_9STAP|nr:glucose 1-dehydrogenase [Jeotgalicoccus aerolatus]NMA80554.1 glucose 1-dehydrogenase [Jeotgalicoccus aerolatus]SDJ89179.1 NAD(P)-dependent dehydrogenase, short-chain alcohol dehydrogenase family [Jeotgalicoccus aerolatus]HJG33716.1 glucose 1-dehydrogenase [Jeotgalicoccus aerolatus]